MPKNFTPEMEALNKRRAKKDGAKVSSSPLKDAWRRLMRNKTALLGMAIIIVLFLVAILAPLITPYSYDQIDGLSILQTPSLTHIFGTDQLGRDMFSRCIYGARITLPIALLAVVVAITLGGTLGIVSAYFGGTVDHVIMRIIDVWGSIPGIMLSIAIVASLGNNINVIVFGLSIGAVPNMARMFRGAIFTVVDNDYVESSKVIGASNKRIMFMHLLPNAVGPVILAIVNLLGVEVLCISTLSFIGVGINPPIPEWGALLSAGKEFLSTYPHLCIFPGLCIMLAVLGFNLLGNGLRDALDPRLK